MASRFRRPKGNRRYKRMFMIVAEGTVTEREYFSLLNDDSIVRVTCVKNKNNLSPSKALARVQEYVAKERLKKTDAVWVVIDRDSWPEEWLLQLHAWASKQKNFGFALTNPKFEYWLLLHFEDAKGINSSNDCDTKLKRYIEDYNKHIDARLFTRERIIAAIMRAKQRDTPPCKDWPRQTGSTVYKLVYAIITPSE